MGVPITEGIHITSDDEATGFGHRGGVHDDVRGRQGGCGGLDVRGELDPSPSRTGLDAHAET